jgi:Fe-S-cluster containining protein
MKQYVDRLSEIYRAIDSAYSEALRRYNFSCDGCPDNCCVTKFHHHTLVEDLYLEEGLKKLDEAELSAIASRAEEVVKAHKSSGENVEVMCPLNENGSCVLYEYRPMICRIHGVPYELFRNFKMEYGDGCYRFIMEKENVPKDFRINRTPFYLEIAQIEREVREKLNFTGRYKKTTAEMVLSIIDGKRKA